MSDYGRLINTNFRNWPL